MKTLRWLIVVIVVAGLLAACAPVGPVAKSALPKAKEGTLLRKIQDRGKIVVGVKFDVPMFGLLNPTTNKVEGFDVDIEIGRAHV